MGRLRPPLLLSASADLVVLVVLHGRRHVSPLVLDAMPEVLGPVLDPRPHPPEVLLGDLTEGSLGLVRGHLLGGVIVAEDPSDESVLERLFHVAPCLSI